MWGKNVVKCGKMWENVVKSGENVGKMWGKCGIFF